MSYLELLAELMTSVNRLSIYERFYILVLVSFIIYLLSGIPLNRVYYIIVSSSLYLSNKNFNLGNRKTVSVFGLKVIN